MRSNARKFIATCALLALGAIVVLTVGCGAQKQAAPPATTVLVRGGVHNVHIRHNGATFDLPDSEKVRRMNRASEVFWRFKKYENVIDHAEIKFDSTHTPFHAAAFTFTPDDFGIESGTVIVGSNPLDTFHYQVRVYLKSGKVIQVDPGIIIDDGAPMQP